MTKESRSRYILLTPWDEPTEIDIDNWKDGGLFVTYWVRVFQEFEKISPLSGLTFYLVWNHILVPELPSYGENVVAVIATDEECAFPPYLNKVRFVFKTIGFYPWCGSSLRAQSAASAEVRKRLDEMGVLLRFVSAEEWIFTQARPQNGDAHGLRATDRRASQAVRDAPLLGRVSWQH